ncbi:hypothetical protein [Spongiactinospora sp. 9N601]
MVSVWERDFDRERALSELSGKPTAEAARARPRGGDPAYASGIQSGRIG